MRSSVKFFIVAALLVVVADVVLGFSFNVDGEPLMNESVTLIPGENIAITQNTANKTVTITGAATWNMAYTSSFNQLKAKTIVRNTTGDIGIPGSSATLFAAVGGWIFDVHQHFYDRNTNITVYDQKIELNSGGGVVLLDGMDIRQELVKASVKSFQADFRNSSENYMDYVLIPLDMNMTNITSLIDGTEPFVLNFSIELYESYPGSKFEVVNYSLNSSLNFIDDIDFAFDNKDIILLNYTSASNVTLSNIMFKFKVR